MTDRSNRIQGPDGTEPGSLGELLLCGLAKTVQSVLGMGGLGGRFDYALDRQQYAVMCSR